MKDSEIKFGDGISLMSFKPLAMAAKKGGFISFEITWCFHIKLPSERMISYYIGSCDNPCISFLDTKRTFCNEMSYDVIREGETIIDIITMSIPADCIEGRYEVSVFVYPIDKFEVKSNKSKVNNNQAFLFEIEVLGEIENSLKNRYKFLEKNNNRNFFSALTRHLQPSANDPNVDMWFQFAFSCNDRGESCAELIKKYKPIKNTSCLDVGSAYGGFLVALANEGASRVVGLDIDASLIKLAHENLKDKNISPELYLKDVTKDTDVSEFHDAHDIITCNDVIEHVDSPRAAITNMAKMLKKDGLLYLEIPNKFYPGFVLKDGHFSIFGITLLEHEDAKRYFNLLHPQINYTVGHYLSINQYKRLFEDAGLSFQILDETFTTYNRQKIFDDIDLLMSEYDVLINSVPSNMRGQVSSSFEKYQTDLKKSIDDEVEFGISYGVSFWKVIGIKR